MKQKEINEIKEKERKRSLAERIARAQEKALKERRLIFV